MSSWGFGYKTAVRWQKNHAFEEERKQYAEKMRVLRKKHLAEYWERQT